MMALPKIFTPDIAPHASFALDATGEFFFTGGAAGGYGILVSEEVNRSFILGLLNSRLLEWFIRQTSTQMRGGWFSFEARYSRELPVAGVDDRSRTAAREIAAATDRLCALTAQREAVRVAAHRSEIERQSNAIRAQLDELVYRLYDLSRTEIEMVEQEVARPSA